MSGGRISENKIQEIRDRIDIVEVISSYLPLKRSGANHQGLCPFHGEKTPSFNVNSPRQIFHCFGCGVGGNVFSFLMRMEGLTFPEAVRRMGERVGVEVEQEEVTPAEIQRRKEREQFDLVNEEACSFYQRMLLDAPEGEPARRYLKARGYDRAAAENYRIGYAPNEWELLAKHLAEKNLDPQIARQLGLIRPGKQGRGDYDLFRGRLLFPIRDVAGKVVAFGGRILDDSLPKYINSPESPVYFKSRVLFGLFLAKEEMRKAGEVIVVEGYFDQLALNRSGLGHALATCGTALTADHARLLKRYTDRVVLLFDQDKAGRQATFRAMDALLPSGLPVAVATLPDNSDPDSFLQAQGAEALREQLSKAVPALDFFIEAQLAEGGSDVEAQARAIEAIVAKIKLLASDVEQRLYLSRLAERSGLDERFLLGKLSKRSSRTERPSYSSDVKPPVQTPAQVVQAPGWVLKPQKWVMSLILGESELGEKAREKVFAEDFENFIFSVPYRDIAEKLAKLMQESDFNLNRFLACLTPEQSDVLSDILIKEDELVPEDEDRNEFLEKCLRATENSQLKWRRQALPALLEKAKQDGDTIQHDALLRERMDINRKLKQSN